ncbi:MULTISPECIES: DUF4124 domain-containing protein [unclassified Janthinobacterium]|uniref:DUF4124 domain-containing protein n=1 Tax=unclassified Janthinobacterium TaxID=2610881 RepID=UPI0009DA6826|nr:MULTISPECIES: DUF4124 domain-containing protein [unclassified Janthinobacterium]MEC5160440.1 hypothetical protein [Janthinobacterium sp. CG_S6]
MANKKKNKLAWLGAFLMLSQVSPASHAEIYKWVDANGKTQYSDNKDQAGKAQVEELKVKSTPAPSPPTASSMPTWQQREMEFKRRQLEKNRMQEPFRISEGPKARWTFKPNQPETDATRCDLAHDVKSGAVSHRNGERIDSNDREVADRDIRAYCR